MKAAGRHGAPALTVLTKRWNNKKITGMAGHDVLRRAPAWWGARRR
jgi:hypothetical protein